LVRVEILIALASLCIPIVDGPRADPPKKYQSCGHVDVPASLPTPPLI